MTIRKPIDYLKIAKQLRTERQGGAIALPVPSVPSRRKDVVRPAAPEPAPELSGYRGTRKYALITEPDELAELVALLEGVPEVAFDIETYPLDDSNTALDPRRGRVRLVSVAAEGSIGGVVDVTKVVPEPLLRTLKDKTLIAHNGKFELSFLKNRFGYEHDGPVVDTTILDTILYYAAGPRKLLPGWLGFPQDEDRRRSLKDVAADFIGAELDKEEQTSDFGLEDLTDAQIRYSLHDAEILIPLKDAMMERLRDLGLEKVAELEARFLPALAYCENNGFALDTVGWREEALRAKAEAERLWAHCDALSPPGPNRKGQKGWNWRSAKQIGEVFKLLGVSLPKTDKGNDKTGESTLKGVTSPEKAVSLAETLLRLREQNKRASWGREWLDLPKWKGKRFDKDHQFVVNGRVHASFGQVIKTGRMRCSKPNLQGLPSEFRRYFVAPPGRKLIVADYKNFELVLAGVVAGEDNLLEAFRRGEDVHSLTARGMLESDPKRAGRLATDEEIKEFRPVAKLVSFSILYGSGAKGLAEGMTNRVGVPTTKEEAQALMGNFFQAYPRLKSWYVKEHAKAKAGDERSRTLTGRMRLLDKEYRYGRWCVKPQLRLSSPIQGSAGDGLKYAATIAWERRRECPGDPKLVNLVHDEIVLEIDEEHAEVGKVWLERCMLDGMAEVAGADVPASVEIEIADSW